jgi:hypothetical protein
MKNSNYKRTWKYNLIVFIFFLHIFFYRGLNVSYALGTICRSTHYDHFVPYADRYNIWPFPTICRLTHMTISNHIKKYIMTISYHMQIDTLWPFRTICRSIHYYNFVPCQSAYGRKWSYIVSICIWYEMVIMCRSAYGTKGVAYVEASVKKYMQKKI